MKKESRSFLMIPYSILKLGKFTSDFLTNQRTLRFLLASLQLGIMDNIKIFLYGLFTLPSLSVLSSVANPDYGLLNRVSQELYFYCGQ